MSFGLDTRCRNESAVQAAAQTYTTKEVKVSLPKKNLPVRTLANVLEEEIDGIQPEPVISANAAQENERLKAVFARIHAAPARSALCFSGGGIRSASFGLGVLQGVAKARLFECLDYVSTVSGGGYLGGWLSAWMHREAEARRLETKAQPSSAVDARAAVVRKLSTPADTAPRVPEWPPIHFLRAFSNYLTPKLGFLSADTWALAATFLRNMLLNWLVLLPLLLGVLMVSRVFMAAVLSRMPAPCETACWGAAVLLLSISTAYAAIDMPGTGTGQRRESKFLLFRLLPLVGAAFAIVLGWAWRYNVLADWAPYFASAQPPMVLWLPETLAIPSPPGVRPMLSIPKDSELLLLLGLPVLLGGLYGAIARSLAPACATPPRHPFSFAKIQQLAVTLLCTWIGVKALQKAVALWFSEPTRGHQALHLVCYAPSVLIVNFLLLNFLLAGLSSWVTDDEDREWWARSSGWLLLSALALALQGTLVFWGPFWLQILQQKAHSLSTVLGWFGISGGLSGALAALRGFSSRTAAKTPNAPSSTRLLHVGALIFLVVLVVLLAVVTDFAAGDVYALTFYASDGTFNRTAMLPWLLTTAFLVGGGVMGWFINVNKFSLHTMYRNRLIRCFLGASRVDRVPHPFTGFDRRDNVKMAELDPGGPLHIVNIALNIVATKNLAWQERKARSFTVSRLHAGAAGIGYQPADTFGDGISLGTAVTISGAAASPNMGYHSSPLIALLMTLFNVRLGWWLANPGEKGRAVWRCNGPRFAAGPLIAEALGKTTDDYKYVNLSDGGHFENLGIYEMVQRRCRHIIAVDGGQDANYVFDDLGNAIRKIRIDLGIRIEITLKSITPKLAKKNPLYCAIGEIHYEDVDPAGKIGRLIYIKPVVIGDEPADISNYRAAHPEFPHESTGDQFFSESQLESYRMLGAHAFEKLRGEAWSGDAPEDVRLAQFFTRVEQYTAPRAQVTKASLRAPAA